MTVVERERETRLQKGDGPAFRARRGGRVLFVRSGGARVRDQQDAAQPQIGWMQKHRLQWPREEKGGKEDEGGRGGEAILSSRSSLVMVLTERGPGRERPIRTVEVGIVVEVRIFIYIFR